MSTWINVKDFPGGSLAKTLHSQGRGPGLIPCQGSRSHMSWLPRWLRGKESACQCKRHRRCRFEPWVRKVPWRRKWQPTLVFLPVKSHGPRSLVGYSPWGCKESNTTKATYHLRTYTKFLLKK